MLTIRPAAALLFAVAAMTILVNIFGADAAHAAAAGLQALDPGSFLMATPALVALRDRRTALVAELRGMIDAAEAHDRDLSAEEQSAYDGKKAELDGLDKRIERAAGVAEAEARQTAVVPAAGRGNGPQNLRAPGDAAREFSSLGEFMYAVRFRPNDQRLNYVETNPAAVDPETGEMRAEFRMDNDASGGFMVPPQLRTTIMRVEPQGSLVRPRANVIPAGDPPDAAVIMPALDQGGTNPGNMYGGVEVRWIGEGEYKPETDAKLRQITLTPHEVAGHVTITDKLLRNWQANGPFLEGLLRGAVTGSEDYAFQRGTGVHQPLGATNSGAMKYINRAQANHVGYMDLLTMVSRFLMRDGQPVWSMPQSALVDIATMTDPEGHYIWKPNAVDGFAGTLLGYPLRWNNRAPALGQKGDVTLCDWSQYLIKDGSGPFVAASEHVKFLENKTVIKIFWNVDGAPWLTAPIKEENGYEVSPFVGLDVPA